MFKMEPTLLFPLLLQQTGGKAVPFSPPPGAPEEEALDIGNDYVSTPPPDLAFYDTSRIPGTFYSRTVYSEELTTKYGSLNDAEAFELRALLSVGDQDLFDRLRDYDKAINHGHSSRTPLLIARIKRARKELQQESPTVLDHQFAEGHRLLNLYSLGLLYRVTAQASRMNHNGDRYHEELKVLNQERQAALHEYQPLTRLEANLHLLNFSYVSRHQTSAAGGIVTALREEGAEAAAEQHRMLKKEAAIIFGLTSDFSVNVSYDLTSERLAMVEWDVAFEAALRRDLSQEALTGLAETLERHAHTATFGARLGKLQEEAPWLFEKGKLNPHVDMSKTEIGSSAASRTRSNYFTTGSWLEENSPLIATTLYVIAAASTRKVSFLKAFVATSLVQSGFSLHGMFYVGGEATAQSRTTGLSQTTREQNSKNNKTFLTDFGLRALGNAVTALPVGSLLLGTTHILKGVVQRSVLSEIGHILGPKALWSGFRGLKAGSQIRLGLSLLYPLDYVGGFGEAGRVDTVFGHIGAAAFWSEVSFRTFSLTWKYTTTPIASNLLGTGQKTYIGFANQMELAPWRAGLIHIGADLCMADYFLLDKNYRFLNFAMSQDSAADRKEFEKQFELDSWMGKMGLLLMFGDWAITHYRGLEMFCNTRTQLVRTQRRILFTSATTAADFGSDGELNNWLLGGVGGALLMNEASSIIFGVNVGASAVMMGLGLLQEVMIQSQQGVSWTSPDAMRLLWTSFESAYMRFPLMAFVLGGSYLKTFTLGQRMMDFHRWLGERAPSIGHRFRSLRQFQEPPSLQGWKVVKVKASHGMAMTLDRGTQKYQGIRQMELYKEGRHNMVRITQGADTHIVPLARVYEAEHKSQYKELVKLIHANGYIVGNNGTLYQVQANFRGTYRPLGQRMTANDVMTLPEAERASVMAELKGRNLRVVGEAGDCRFEWHRIKDPFRPLVRGTRPRGEGHYEERQIPFEQAPGKTPGTLKLHFEREWAPWQRDTVVVSALQHKVPLFLEPLRPLYKAGQVVSRGRFEGALRTVSLFEGNVHAMALQMRWGGIALTGLWSMAYTYASNYFIFSKTYDGDPDYQSWQRMSYYGVVQLLINPYVSWRLGYDNWFAQLMGKGLFGTGTKLGANGLFPTYRNSWPGHRSYYARLDGEEYSVFTNLRNMGPEAIDTANALIETAFGGQDPLIPPDLIDRTPQPTVLSALDGWENAMTSTQIMPSWDLLPEQIRPGWEVSKNSFTAYEIPALNSFRQAEVCWIEALFESASAAADNCRMMNDRLRKGMVTDINKTLKKENNRAVFDTRMNTLSTEIEERIRNWESLSLTSRRGVLIMAAHIQYVTRLLTDRENLIAPERYQDLIEHNPWLFENIATVDTQSDWENWIHRVNQGELDRKVFPPSNNKVS